LITSPSNKKLEGKYILRQQLNAFKLLFDKELNKIESKYRAWPGLVVKADD
jgi:hypothetical protein